MRLSDHAVALDHEPSRAAWIPAGAWRRHDPLTRLACTAIDRLQQRERLGPDTALVLTTSYGAVHATKRFVDSMLSYGDKGASPTPFTASVHNGSAGAIGQLLDLHGPCTTLSQGGTGCLAALRWAQLQLDAGRCDTVLLLAGECHSPWSSQVVSELSPSRWPIGSGMSATVLRASGPGRVLRSGEHPAPRCLDGGGLGSSEARLARDAAAQQQLRSCAGDLLGAWWPTATLAALPALLAADEAIQLRERDGLDHLAWWCGPAV
ncbi:MAG: beta-ketoacyl synthase chain length factor [Planctomycetota bacterium]|jgi:hypothetical protein|nr:beta-ketoacyl synthase chain length factor [Planctomycetota bacterium]